MLFSQLSRAHADALALGVHLVVDFVIDAGEPLDQVCDGIIAASRAASVVRIVGVRNVYRQPIHCFGEGVCERIGEVQGSSVLVDDHMATPGWLEQRLEGLPQDVVAQVRARKDEIIRTTFRPCRDMLTRAARETAVCLLMDEDGTKLFGPEMVNSFGLLPTGPEVELPNRLSPEMLSEFPEEVPAELISQEVRRRAAFPTKLSTVYLHDLLVAAGDWKRERPEPLQLINEHCRFRLPVALDVLGLDDALTAKIRGVASAKPA